MTVEQYRVLAPVKRLVLFLHAFVPEEMGQTGIWMLMGGRFRANPDTVKGTFRLDDGRVLSVVEMLTAELRPYQLDGYRWLSRLAACGLGACLADGMGLGKTLQVIALLLERAADGASLVVVPSSVCGNWRREIRRFARTAREAPEGALPPRRDGHARREPPGRTLEPL